MDNDARVDSIKQQLLSLEVDTKYADGLAYSQAVQKRRSVSDELCATLRTFKQNLVHTVYFPEYVWLQREFEPRDKLRQARIAGWVEFIKKNHSKDLQPR